MGRSKGNGVCAGKYLLHMKPYHYHINIVTLFFASNISMTSIKTSPYDELPDNPYFLLTPGPLSTSKTVKQVMLRDWCTWDTDYNSIVQEIRQQLVKLACANDEYTAVLMQGSGTYTVESVISTAIPEKGKLLVIANGVYGHRIATIADRAGIPYETMAFSETSQPDINVLEQKLAQDKDITHVAVVHCETTTGMLNPIERIGQRVKKAGLIYIVDAMSSFGGIPIDLPALQADFLVSSANKCIQGVPGFGFVIARKREMATLAGRARSLSLDLYDQWKTMEEHNGKWRFTSPTHTVRAFAQAICELNKEGGIRKRYERYLTNHAILIEGMTRLGFCCLLEDAQQSPIITSFYSPDHPDYAFSRFYAALKSRGFVIYPGKVTNLDTFRIGNIGHIFPDNMKQLIKAVEESMYW